MNSNQASNYDQNRPIHTEVLVVGNGPSAIALSFLLSGNRPYYNGKPLANEYLEMRLKENLEESLIDKNLEGLCEGLEGRSNNPVALLFDHLSHPNADFGEDNPSRLEWKCHTEHEIPHIVLGKTRPGGTWQQIDGSMQTISQSSWMEMPTAPFKDWLLSNSRSDEASDTHSVRATIAHVKQYYLDFVKSKNLDRNFHDFHTVTSVQPVFHLRNIVDDESGEIEPCCPNVRRNHAHCWEVRGYKSILDDEGEAVARHEFCYIAPYVVLATGTYDVPNRLGVEGENLNNVVHNLSGFEQKLSSGLVSPASDPVVIVGAGLSAADCILMALEANIPVIHIFRRRPNDPSHIFTKLPQNMYPEYHRVHSLMKGKEVSELYRPLSLHVLMEVMPNKVLVKSKESKDMTHFEVSCVAIMIGSQSDLSFLPGEGRHLGMVPKWRINSKHNTINIDPYTYQLVHEPQLFAMGPLVGDNFVRFGIGGSLGIVNHLHKCRKKHSM